MKKLKPSDATHDYWIYSCRDGLIASTITKRTGKWLLFPPTADADAWWERIDVATISGKLGFAAKVSTALPSGPSWKAESRVICVYTYDWEDEDDIVRVAEGLIELGWAGAAYYKTDQDTRSRKYAVSGHQNISKYSLRDGKVTRSAAN